MKGKKVLALCLLVTSILLVPGCIVQVQPQPKPGPGLKVVFPEQSLREYIQLARAGAGNLDSIYWEKVLGPIQRELDRDNSSLKIANYHQTIYDLDELENALDQLAQADVTSIVRSALVRSNEYIQGVDIAVFIIPCNPADEFTRDQMRGVRGVTGLTCQNTIIAINPLALGWQETLPYVAAHEYHHAIWGIRHGHKWEGNVLEVLVMEGKADAFANIVYPNLDVPWTHSLPWNIEQQVWLTLRAELDSTDLVYAKKVTQDQYWSGYAIGCHIVQVFIYNHPDLSIDEWTALPSSELFRNSGYEDWLAGY